MLCVVLLNIVEGIPYTPISGDLFSWHTLKGNTGKNDTP